MAGVLIKGTKAYNYSKAVKGPSYIRLYNEQGLCFKHFLNISDLGFTNFAIYRLTEDTVAVEGKTYYTRVDNVFTMGDFNIGVYEADEYDIPDVAGVGSIAADVGDLVDKKLTVILPTGIYVQNKLDVNFRTPVANTEITHIVISGEEFELVDSCKNSVADYTNAFVASSIISVIIDMSEKKAIVQNLNFDIEATLETSIESILASKTISTVEENSDKLVTSGGVYTYVTEVTKNIEANGGITVDSTITEGSANAVSSSAVYTHVDTIVGDVTTAITSINSII